MSGKPVCIIPARGGSKRFPRKNLALLKGKSLLAHAIEAGLESNIFDRVCVSSEDTEILEVAVKNGAVGLKRESWLATDKVQVWEVCMNVLKQFEEQGLVYETLGLLLTTNPLRTALDICEAYKVFKREDANCLMSLVPCSHPPQRAVWVPQGYVEPYFGQQYMKQTQLLDILYRHDGSVVFAKTNAIIKEQSFFIPKTVPYYSEPERSVDIDNPIDLAWAEFLVSRSDADSEGED